MTVTSLARALFCLASNLLSVSNRSRASLQLGPVIKQVSYTFTDTHFFPLKACSLTI